LHVEEAVRILEGDGASAPDDFDPEACRRRAWEARRSWLEAVEGPVDRLPQLTAQLFRLEQLERQFQATLETEKLEALAEFAAGAGHEINNPLAIIGGRAQLLLKDETDPERRRDLALVNAQVKRAHEMIADMRLFARPPQPQPESVDLVELVEGLLDDLGLQAAERAVSLSRSGDEGPLEIEADPAQLDVALRALCRNALEAIGHGGHVEISLRGLSGQVEIGVTDNGPGILPDHRRHLFDPFYSSRQAGRGLGFGLSKCWRIVTNHGGRIEVESEPGQGATFTITLPRRGSAGGS
jgi:signal transduction histidine kinase